MGITLALSNRESGEWSAPYGGSERWVSLSPELTEAMFAIGAGPALVGRTSECTTPVPARRIRDVGPPGAPDPEAIASLDPTGIMVLQGRAPDGVTDALELPWGTIEEITESVRELGDRFDVSDRAERLAESYEALANPREEPAGPRTLVLFDAQPDRARFAAQNTLYGYALASAGLRNAVARDFTTDPVIRFADLPEIAPDVIVLLVEESVDTARKEALLAPLRDLGTGAALDVIGQPSVLSRGPSVLSLPALLKARVAALVEE